MRFSELIRRIGAAAGATGADPEVRRICEDSRKVEPDDLFVARSGTKANGAQFVADALANGAVAVVSEEGPIAIPGLDRIGWARVENANRAAALLAHELAGNPTAGMKMIAVTGTKGKTTVAYLLRSVLKAAGHKVGMIGTVEIDNGKTVMPAEMTTPGAVELVEMFSRMRENGVTHCVMEVSSHALHQQRVAGIDFAVAIFTNLTGDHLDYHKTMEEYAAAKAILFEGLKEGAVAVVNADDKWCERVVKNCHARIVRFSISPHVGPHGPALHSPAGGWSAGITLMTSAEMRVYVEGPNDQKAFLTTPLIGRHNAYNILCSVATVYAIGVDPLEGRVARKWLSCRGAPGRLEPVVPYGRHRNALPFQVFVDYAHTHDALENVLKALQATMGDGRLICVFGCGGDRDRTKRPKMGAVAERLADVVIVTSDNPRTEEPGAIIEEICAGFSNGWKTAGKIFVEPDRRAAIERAIGMAEKGDVVLLAGKGHENYQIVGTTKHHFDDVEEAAAVLQRQNV